MGHFLKVNQDGDIDLGGEGVHAAELRPGGFDVKFELAESSGAILDGLGEDDVGVGLSDIGAREPDEAAGIFGLRVVDLRGGAGTGEQVRLGDAAALHVRDVGFGLRTQVQVHVEHG